MTDYISREEAEKRLFQRAEIANSAYIDQTPCQIMMLARNVVHLIPAADVVERPRWIPVTERMPEDGQWGLVWGHGQKISIMMFCENGAWIDDQFEWHPTITHWMPLPEPPKEVDT